MDKRILKTGLFRLRFKLSERAMDVVTKAIELAECRYPHTAMERISAAYLSGRPTPCQGTAKGFVRFLVRLYPEQFELMMFALDGAKGVSHSDEDALLHLCSEFIRYMKASQ
ncbi:MAG TPA: hypothetical protein VGK97_04840 [Spongiibacteraceae bacterium]|jgi:hypothetical protein